VPEEDGPKVEDAAAGEEAAIEAGGAVEQTEDNSESAAGSETPKLTFNSVINDQVTMAHQGQGDQVARFFVR
jgi:hypothetical protein